MKFAGMRGLDKVIIDRGIERTAAGVGLDEKIVKGFDWENFGIVVIGLMEIEFE